MVVRPSLDLTCSDCNSWALILPQNLLRIHKNKSCGGMKSSSLAVAESKPKCELCLYEASTWKGQKKHWWNMHKEFLILDLKCQKCGHEAASLASCPLELLPSIDGG